MTDSIGDLLKKQFRLLSERSENENSDIVALTHAMCEIAAIFAGAVFENRHSEKYENTTG